MTRYASGLLMHNSCRTETFLPSPQNRDDRVDDVGEFKEKSLIDEVSVESGDALVHQVVVCVDLKLEKKTFKSQ